jgi:hypothetical protein
MAWGVEHIPAQETQNTQPAVSSTDKSSGNESASGQNIQADDQNKNQYSDALQQYQQSIQELNNVVSQQGAKNRIPPPVRVQQSNGPQVKQGQKNAPACSGSNCVWH